MEKSKGEVTLTREDFDGGPISLDLIEENLYLGTLIINCIFTLWLSYYFQNF